MKEQQQRSDRRWRRGCIAAVLAAAALAGTQEQATQLVANAPLWSWALLALAGAVMLRGSR